MWNYNCRAFVDLNTEAVVGGKQVGAGNGKLAGAIFNSGDVSEAVGRSGEGDDNHIDSEN